jgi:hypothetical protein
MANDEQGRIDQETRADRDNEREGRTTTPRRETFEQRRARWAGWTSAFRTVGAK